MGARDGERQSECRTGGDAHDLPLPQRNRLSSLRDLSPALDRVLRSFRAEQRAMRRVHQLYASLDASTMRREAAAFLRAHANTSRASHYKQIYSGY